MCPGRSAVRCRQRHARKGAVAEAEGCPGRSAVRGPQGHAQTVVFAEAEGC